ncbi:MAG TPA: hypothetical protein VGM90_13040 [Kofleriaceae bacterium]|jgi:hypothetical protein
MRFALAAVLLTACASDGEQAATPDAPTVELPAGCDYELSLNGSSGSSGAQQIGPVSVDATGKRACLHLDATHNLVYAHFDAGTPYIDGTTSPFAVSLYDMQGAMLVDGWDLTIDDTNPRTFTHLEWNAPLGQITDAVVWVRAHDAAATSTFNFSLFEPYE